MRHAGLLDSIQQHLTILDKETRDLLNLAAACGRESEPRILALAAKLDVETVLSQIDDAVAARVLEFRGSGSGNERTQFVHTLISETLYAALPAERRLQQVRGELAGDLPGAAPRLDPRTLSEVENELEKRRAFDSRIAALDSELLRLSEETIDRSDLKRLRVGPIELGPLEEGTFRLLTEDEVKNLRKAVARAAAAAPRRRPPRPGERRRRPDRKPEPSETPARRDRPEASSQTTKAGPRPKRAVTSPPPRRPKGPKSRPGPWARCMSQGFPPG